MVLNLNISKKDSSAVAQAPNFDVLVNFLKRLLKLLYSVDECNRELTDDGLD